MTHEQKERIIAGGQEQAYKASIGRVRAEVELEFAPLISKAGFWRRIVLRFRIQREVQKRMRKIAPPGALYVTPGESRKK